MTCSSSPHTTPLRAPLARIFICTAHRRAPPQDRDDQTCKSVGQVESFPSPPLPSLALAHFAFTNSRVETR